MFGSSWTSAARGLGRSSRRGQTSVLDVRGLPCDLHQGHPPQAETSQSSSSVHDRCFLFSIYVWRRSSCARDPTLLLQSSPVAITSRPWIQFDPLLARVSFLLSTHLIKPLDIQQLCYKNVQYASWIMSATMSTHIHCVTDHMLWNWMSWFIIK